MGLWFSFFFWVGTSILSALLARPRIEGQRPSGLDEFGAPTATEGRALPIGVGKFRQDGSNCTWYGDLQTRKVREKVGGFLGIGAQKVTKAYQYFIGAQLVVCSGPIGGFHRVWMGDKIIYDTAETSSDVSVDNEEFFGGEDRGGGIKFTLEFFDGAEDQPVSSYLSSQLTLTPRYQNVAYFMLSDGADGPGYIGNSPNLRNLSFECFWYPNSLGVTGGRERIGDDANPICFLYELLVANDDWGVLMPGSDVLVTGTAAQGALRAVAEQVADEGLGFSGLIDRPMTAAQLIKEIERHVDGAFNFDLLSGQFIIRLARPTADPVPVLDESNVELLDFSRPTWAQVFTKVRIDFADRAKEYGKTFALDTDLANRDILQRTRPHTMSFPFVKDATVAQIIAAREMFTLGAPAARGKVKAKGELLELLKGDPVQFSWAGHEIAGLPMRVNRIKYGSATNAEMRIDLVEDVFRLEPPGIVAPPSSDWVPINSDPLAPLDQRLWQILPPLSEGNTDRRVATLATRNGGQHLSYDIFADLAGGTNFVIENRTEDWTPTAQLNGGIPDSTATIAAMVIDTRVDATFAEIQSWARPTFDLTDPENLILIDDELMWFEGVIDNGNGTFSLTNVHRAGLGTTIAAHADNARVWFVSQGAGLVSPDLLNVPPQTINVRLLPRTATGIFDLASATTLSITTVGLIGYGFDYGNNYGGGN